MGFGCLVFMYGLRGVEITVQRYEVCGDPIYFLLIAERRRRTDVHCIYSVQS